MDGSGEPIGATLWRVANAVARAFDDALAEGGGSRAMWAVLRALRVEPAASQRQIAAAVGIQDATVTHHLTAMEADGLVVRRRDPENRRVQLIELTAAGEEAFKRLSRIAVAFDARLREGFSSDDLDAVRAALARLHSNALAAAAAEAPDLPSRRG